MSDLSWLGRGTIFLGVSGSHAYGTSLPGSDVDLRGVAVAPLRHYLGCSKGFEQVDALPAGFWGALGSEGRGPLRALAQSATDAQVMDVRKFMRLASDCNPNVIEILFLPEECFAHATAEWEKLIAVRRACVSKRARFTFAGYAHSQLKRIRTHRRWLLEPPAEKPTRAAFGLKERLPIPKDQFDAAKALVERRIQEWSLDPETEIPETVLAKVRSAMVDLVSTIRPDEDPTSVMMRAAGAELGIADGFMQVLHRERRYRQALAWFHQYQEWKANRNRERAVMEERCGYDVKHGSHLIRLLRMACEILRDGQVVVRRPDAEELRAIRRGEWTFERLLEESERLDAEAARLHATTALPPKADVDAVDVACESVILSVDASR